MKTWDELTKEEKFAAVESIATPGWLWPMRAESAWKFFCKLATAPETKEPEHRADDGTIRKDHYGAGRQPWDEIVDAGWGAAFAAGNALKYVRRFKNKNGEDDLAKGRWYAARLHEMVHRPGEGVLLDRVALLISKQLKGMLTEEEFNLLYGPSK